MLYNVYINKGGTEMDKMQELVKMQSLLADIGKRLIDLGYVGISLAVMKAQIDILNQQRKIAIGGTEE